MTDDVLERRVSKIRGRAYRETVSLAGRAVGAFSKTDHIETYIVHSCRLPENMIISVQNILDCDINSTSTAHSRSAVFCIYHYAVSTAESSFRIEQREPRTNKELTQGGQCFKGTASHTQYYLQHAHPPQIHH